MNNELINRLDALCLAICSDATEQEFLAELGLSFVELRRGYILGHAAETAPAVEWIKVSDRLPDTPAEYLVSRNGYQYLVQFQDGHWRSSEDDVLGDVTHWTPNNDESETPNRKVGGTA